MAVLGLGSESSYLVEIDIGASCHPNGCGRQRPECRGPRKAGEPASILGVGKVAPWIDLTIVSLLEFSWSANVLAFRQANWL